jgi:hypothetical protein
LLGLGGSEKLLLLLRLALGRGGRSRPPKSGGPPRLAPSFNVQGLDVSRYYLPAPTSRLDQIKGASVFGAFRKSRGHSRLLFAQKRTPLQPEVIRRARACAFPIATNFFGAVAVMRAVIPQMRKRREGTIINVTSISGRFGLPFMSPYDATKFAIEGMSESLRYELESFGIRIKLVEPGGVKTNFAHEWVSHPAYEPTVSGLMAKMTAGASKAKGPEGVAHVLFKAATDQSRRFRYSANGAAPFLLLNRVLPDHWWRALVRSIFLNRRKSSQ